jgi:hypothetical protein
MGLLVHIGMRARQHQACASGDTSKDGLARPHQYARKATSGVRFWQHSSDELAKPQHEMGWAS